MNETRQTKVLVIDDDPGHLTTLRTIIRSWGYAIETEENKRLKMQLNADLEVSDLFGPGGIDGLNATGHGRLSVIGRN